MYIKFVIKMNATSNNDSLNASAWLNSFGQYSTDDMDTTNEENAIQSDAVTSEINCVMDYKSKHKMTLKSSSDLAVLLNGKPNPHVYLPTNISNLKKNTNMHFTRESILICKCGKLCNEKNYCVLCKIENTKSKSNFVVKIPLVQQNKYLLNKYSDKIVSYSKREKNEKISDIDDGLVFKAVSKEYPDCIILSFTINSDGAPAYNSNKTSMWPIQMYAVSMTHPSEHS